MSRRRERPGSGEFDGRDESEGWESYQGPENYANEVLEFRYREDVGGFGDELYVAVTFTA